VIATFYERSGFVSSSWDMRAWECPWHGGLDDIVSAGMKIYGK
jgi:hypothetical protein